MYRVGQQPIHPLIHPPTHLPYIQQAISLIRALLMFTQTLETLPDHRTLALKLLYYDDRTPADYEPPFFEQARGDALVVEDKGCLRVKIGSVVSRHFSLDLKFVGVDASVHATEASPLVAETGGLLMKRAGEEEEEEEEEDKAAQLEEKAAPGTPDGDSQTMCDAEEEAVQVGYVSISIHPSIPCIPCILPPISSSIRIYSSTAAAAAAAGPQGEGQGGQEEGGCWHGCGPLHPLPARPKGRQVWWWWWQRWQQAQGGGA